MHHWSVAWYHEGKTGGWLSEHQDPVEASRGAKGRCTLYPLSKQAEDICEVNGTEGLVYMMEETDGA